MFDWNRWLNPFKKSSARKPSFRLALAPPHRFRPKVEQLEDRVVPAITTTDLSQGLTPQDLVNALTGPGINSVINIQYSGASVAAGTFTGGTGIVGIEQGVVLSTGAAAGVIGPNTGPGEGTSNGQPGNPALNALIPGLSTFDAATLSFEFIPAGDQLTMRYVFSSEEYNEFVGSEFNDVFAIFVNGQNMAVLPGTNTAVAINNINNDLNSQFFIDNTDGHVDIQMDGLTVVLTLTAPVTAGQSNTMTVLSIADASDGMLDSAVFIEAGSIQSASPNDPPELTVPGPQSTDEDTQLIFSAGTGNVIAVSDPDAEFNEIYLLLDATAGILTLPTTSGLTIINGDNGTSRIEFVGTLDDINAALNGLVFTPPENFNGPVTLTIETNDQGNTGEGGPQGDFKTLTITVHPVNDAPSFTAGPDQTVQQDAGPQTITGWATAISAGPSDESGQSLTFIVTSNTNPSLFAVGPNVDAAGTLTYTAAAGASGTATVTLVLMDDGGTEQGGVDVSEAIRFLITIQAPAELPTVSITADRDAAELGQKPGVFTVTRTGDLTNHLTVFYTVAGTATATDDYPDVGQSVTIPAGQPSATITIAPVDDATAEPTETVSLTLQADPNYNLAAAQNATVRIFDNDTVVTVSVSSLYAHEAPPTGWVQPRVIFSRVGNTAEDLRVFFEVFGSASSNDFSTGQDLFLGEIVIPRGSNSVTINVTPLSDTFTSADIADILQADGIPNNVIPRTFAKLEGTEFLNVALRGSTLQNGPSYRLSGIRNQELAGFFILDTLFLGGQPDPASVIQGQLPCWFAASLASLAQARPGAITSPLFLRDNNNGTYTVTFGFPGIRPQTVEAPSYNSPYDPYLAPMGQSNGIWLPVLKAAYDQAFPTPPETLCDNAQRFMRRLTGFLAFDSRKNDDRQAGIIQDNLRNGRMLVAETPLPNNAAAAAAELARLTAVGLTGPHAYQVVAFDGANITLYNPHGFGEFLRNGQPTDNRNDGLFRMTLAEFREFFNHVAFETDRRIGRGARP